MEKNIIDVKGKPCPIPLIETKKIYDDISINEEILVILDNLISMENVKRFIEESGGEVAVDSFDNEWKVHIKKTTSSPSKEAELFCDISTQNSQLEKKSSFTIYINSEFMGNGDNDLGKILMKGFINTISEMDNLPEHIIFVNGGVKITTKDSPEVESLKKLEKSGIKILSCGTCLNFFEISDNLKVGIASNMYDIMKILTESSNVVTP